MTVRMQASTTTKRLANTGRYAAIKEYVRRVKESGEGGELCR